MTDGQTMDIQIWYLADIFFQSKQRENATFKKTTGGILLMSKSEISSKH